jgi:hypothetical protein
MQDAIVIEAGRRTAQQSNAAPVSNGPGANISDASPPLHDSLRAASEGKPPQARCGSRKTGKISLLVVKLRGTMIMGRLQRELKSNRDAQQTKFRFSWGDLSYVGSENLCSQFDDIFIRRQYAFSSHKSEPVIIDCGGKPGPGP